jgi:hypothetical protein
LAAVGKGRPSTGETTQQASGPPPVRPLPPLPGGQVAKDPDNPGLPAGPVPASPPPIVTRPTFSRPSGSAVDSLRANLNLPVDPARKPPGRPAPAPEPAPAAAPPPGPSNVQSLPPKEQIDPANVPLPPDPPRQTLPLDNFQNLTNPTSPPTSTPAFAVVDINGEHYFDLNGLAPEMKDMWINRLREILATGEDGAFFWSGNVIDQAGERHTVMHSAERMAKLGDRNTLEGMLKDNKIIMPEWGRTDATGKAVWDSVSASTAQGAKGDVFVLLGPNRRADNVFSMTEFPILQNNPNVDRVIAIDFETGERQQLYP